MGWTAILYLVAMVLSGCGQPSDSRIEAPPSLLSPSEAPVSHEDRKRHLGDISSFLKRGPCQKAYGEAQTSLAYQQSLEQGWQWAEAYAAQHGWSLTDFPDPKELDPLLKDLSSIYADGRPAQCPDIPILSKICEITSLWYLQLGSRSMVRDAMNRRSKRRTMAELRDIQAKDAAWAWVYSRYFHRSQPEKAQRLFEADLKETAMMVPMAASLKRDGHAFSELYPAYSCRNWQKYSYLASDPKALSYLVWLLGKGG